MHPLDPDWSGLRETFGRGAHTNDPHDPNYPQHWDIVAGSLNAPLDAMIIGIYLPDPGSGRDKIDANVRFCGRTAYIDRAKMPAAPVKGLKPLNWLAEHRTIEPVGFPWAERDLERDHEGRLILRIPGRYGGGRIVQHLHAVSGRINDASPGIQLRSFWDRVRGPR